MASYLNELSRAYDTLSDKTEGLIALPVASSLLLAIGGLLKLIEMAAHTRLQLDVMTPDSLIVGSGLMTYMSACPTLALLIANYKNAGSVHT